MSVIEEAFRKALLDVERSMKKNNGGAMTSEIAELVFWSELLKIKREEIRARNAKPIDD